MNITIKSVADLGLAVRAVRRSSKVRLDDLAALAGVSKQFTSDVEYGKPTVQFGLVLKLLAELGISLQLDIPKDANAELMALQQQGGPRARAAVNPAVSAKRRSSAKNKLSLTASTERPEPSEVTKSDLNSAAAEAAFKVKGGGDAQS